MSSLQQCISKGYYTHSQIDGFISVKNYLFTYVKDQKYLFIRFTNLTDFVVHSMRFTLSLLDRTGAVLQTREISLDQLTFQPGHTYSPPQAIAVDEFCTDFKLEFSQVTSGKYIYRVEGQRITVLYENNDQPLALTNSQRDIWAHTVRPLKTGRQGLSILCGICLLLLVLGLTIAGMSNRYQDALEEAAKQDASSHMTTATKPAE